MTMTHERLDALVALYAEHEAHAAKIGEDMASIKAEIREGLDDGTHTTSHGIKVSVRPPSRTFNLVKAVELLPEALRDQCRLDGFDAAKVKRFLAPAVLDMVMEPGKGDKVVTIK